MILSVIVPQYKESIEQIRPLLDSLYGQVGIDKKDYEVVICNDGVPDYKPSQEKLIELYPDMNIRVLVNPVNGGCGPARQWGIDHSEADYITCADADDRFTSCFALRQVLDEIPFDFLVTAFIEERFIKSKMSYAPHVHDHTWMHGKFYRRQFLVDNDIQFHPDLRVQEDSYFNSIVGALSTVKYLDTTTYLWKYNEKSTTREGNSEYYFSTLTDYMNSQDYCIQELIKRDNPNSFVKVVQNICYVYLVLNSMSWQTQRAKKHAKASAERFIRFYTKYQNMFFDVPINLVQQQFDKMVPHQEYVKEPPTFNQFIEYLKIVFNRQKPIIK